MKPHRGRQRKPWNKYVDELFDVLGLPKGELLDDIRKGQCPLSLFLSNVNECVSNREIKGYVEGVNSKVKLGLYKAFSKEVEFKRCLHGTGVRSRGAGGAVAPHVFVKGHTPQLLHLL